MASVANHSTAKASELEDLSVRSVNWHVWPHCNYTCRFCFARFSMQTGKETHLARNEGHKLISLLVKEGMEKITFVGGEPMLCPWLGQYLKRSKSLGCLTMIVTNGSLVTHEFMEQYAHYLDWMGLSIDSASENTEKLIGRGRGRHISKVLKVRRMLSEYGIKVKVNVTVTKPVLGESLHELLAELNPDRLKFLQFLPVRGQNDECVKELSVTRQEFYEFVRRHEGLKPIAEDNDMMTGSYVMIDPQGRFVQNTRGIYKYSDAILHIGVWEALSQVGFSWTRLVVRGGAEYFRGQAIHSGQTGSP